MTLATAIQFRQINLPTGVRLHYAERGPQSGQPLLLLHGYSDSWFSFSRILDLIPPEYRLIVPDQRGHGGSEHSPDGYTPEQLAADAITLLNALAIPETVVIGHSLGSFVAQHMAVLSPQCVSRIVLVGGAVTSDKESVRSLVPLVSALTDPVDSTFVREFQLSTIYRPVPPAFLNRVVTESLKLSAYIWKAVLAGLLDRSAIRKVAVIRCPVSLFWGDRDAIFTRSDQEELAQRIPNAQIHIFPETGHAPHWETPEKFVRELMSVFHP